MKKRTQIRVDAYIQKLYYIFINISPNAGMDDVLPRVGLAGRAWAA